VPPGARADKDAGKDAGGQAARATDDHAEVRPIGSLTEPVKATVEGRVMSMAIRPVEQNSVLAVEVADETGTLTALFYGRKHIPGVECGGRLRLSGTVGIRNGRPVMINPVYELFG
jgi:RecG-like helicase